MLARNTTRKFEEKPVQRRKFKSIKMMDLRPLLAFCLILSCLCVFVVGKNDEKGDDHDLQNEGNIYLEESADLQQKQKGDAANNDGKYCDDVCNKKCNCDNKNTEGPECDASNFEKRKCHGIGNDLDKHLNGTDVDLQEREKRNKAENEGRNFCENEIKCSKPTHDASPSGTQDTGMAARYPGLFYNMSYVLDMLRHMPLALTSVSEDGAEGLRHDHDCCFPSHYVYENNLMLSNVRHQVRMIVQEPEKDMYQFVPKAICRNSRSCRTCQAEQTLISLLSFDGPSASNNTVFDLFHIDGYCKCKDN